MTADGRAASDGQPAAEQRAPDGRPATGRTTADGLPADGQSASRRAVARLGPSAARPRLRPGLVALLLGVVAVLGRAVLVGLDSPPSNSDEATMGLAALHIADGRELPVYFYGQDYMGTLEAYLAAPLFWIFGPSVPVLRAPLLLLYALFLLSMWMLTRRLYQDPWFATLAVGVLAAGSDRVLKNQLIAGGGYPEMNPAGALLMLLALNLSLGMVSSGGTSPTPSNRRRLLAVAVWGLVAGAMVWIDVLLLPYIGCAGVVLVLFNRRELGGRAGLVLAGSALLGAAPMLAHAIAGGRNPVSVLLALSGGGDPASWPDRLYGGVLLGIPMGTGFCSPSHCAPWQLWWGVAFPILLTVAGVAAVRALRRKPAGDRARAAIRLALVGAAGLTVIAYASSSAAGNTPVESARYLSCLAISMPAVLWPLWSAVRRRSTRPNATARAGDTARAVSTACAEDTGHLDRTVHIDSTVRRAALGVLAGVLVSLGVASVGAVGAVPGYRRVADDRREMIATLRRLDVRHVYSEYWTCNNITFATREEIVCAVLDTDLRPGLDRYPPYRRLVERADGAAYVLPVDSPGNAVLGARADGGSGGLRRISIRGYQVYLPTDRIP
nr:DUF423 domain-containing protein [Micromonospora sp. DSM 115978]